KSRSARERERPARQAWNQSPSEFHGALNSSLASGTLALPGKSRFISNPRITPGLKLLRPTRKLRPRPGLHVLQQPPHPLILRVLLQKILGDEILLARVAVGGPQLHLPGHLRVHHFRLHRPAGEEFRPVPFGDAARRFVRAAAERTLVRAFLLLERVVAVGFKLLPGLGVNLPLILG